MHWYVRFGMFLIYTVGGVCQTIGGLALFGYIVIHAADASPVLRVLFAGLSLSLSVWGYAEVRAAWVSWRHHLHSTEDLRRDTDFALGGFRAAAGWRRLRNYAMGSFFAFVILLMFFAR